MKELDLKIEDMSEPILNRAEHRIEEALFYALVSTELRKEEIEISSFPVAVMMVASTADKLMKKRYALAEAKRIYELLEEESEDKILEVTRVSNWKIILVDNKPPCEFALFFTDCLRNATRFQAKGWKIVNRVVSKGEVYLTTGDVTRLLQEEVHVHTEKKLDVKEKIVLPQSFTNRVERLKQAFTEHKGKIELKGFPDEVVISAFPPCVKHLYGEIASGNHLSHIERFTLTSFLTNIGMTAEEVIDLYRSLSDFKERLIRYQAEHIAGGLGSRTKYIPPRCDTLRTHRVCMDMDEICRKVRHPLAYYRRKLRTIKAEAPVE